MVRTWGCALLAACLAGGPALAGDAGPEAGPIEVRTKDGRVYRGRVLAETAEVLEIEVASGRIVARVSIPRGEIERARRVDADPRLADIDRQAEEAASEPDASRRARRLAEAARLAASEGFPARAAELYLEAGRAAPEVRDEMDVAAARAHIEAGEEAKAEAVLAMALRRNPKNAAAAAAGRELEAAFGGKADRLLGPALEAYRADQLGRALRLFTVAVEALPAPVLDAASERIRGETGLTVAQMMVDCRLRRPCDGCEGSGVKDCPAATARCRLGRVQRFTRVERVGELKFTRWDYCRRCDGLGHVTCEACGGLGLPIGRPTRYEAAELMGALGAWMEDLDARANALVGRVEGSENELAVRSVAATELLSTLKRLHALTEAVAPLHPAAGAVGAGDLRRKARMTAERLASVMTAVANGLYVLGEKRYEEAVSQDVGTETTTVVPAAVRVARARQAWELVNQARIFIIEALRLDPSAASPVRGDLERRRALVEAFLARAWKTYLVGRAAEQKATDEAALELVLQAAAEALKSGAVSGQGSGRGSGQGTGSGAGR